MTDDTYFGVCRSRSLGDALRPALPMLRTESSYGVSACRWVSLSQGLAVGLFVVGCAALGLALR